MKQRIIEPALRAKFEAMGWNAVNTALIDLTMPAEEDEQACFWLSENRDPPSDPAVFRRLARYGKDEVHGRLVNGRFSKTHAWQAVLWLQRQGSGDFTVNNGITLMAGLGFARREGREKWMKDHPLLRLIDRLGSWRWNKGKAVGMPDFANIRVLPQEAFDPEDKHLFPRVRPGWKPAR